MNIKETLSKIGNWFKARWKQFLAILGTGVLLAQITSTPTPEITSFNIDGKVIEMAYTDDLTNEDLIIRTNQKDYMNWAGNITIYYSVYNNSGKTQDVRTTFSLNDESGGKKYIKDISEYNGEHITFKTVVDSFYSTDTDSIITTTSTVQKTTTLWEKHTLTKFSLPSILNRKTVKNTHSLKNNTFLLENGETKLFKAVIQYTDFKNKEEFFIEAFGSKGAYGHLDPWTYEYKFNSDTSSTGDLNGQDNWAGSAEFDVTTDAAAIYEGNQGLKVVNASAQVTIQNASVGTPTAGVIYIAMKAVTVPSGQRFAVYFYEGAFQKMEMRFDQATGDIRINQGGSFVLVYSNYSLNQWYVFAIEFDAATDEYRAKAHDGNSWSVWCAWGALADSGTIIQIDKIVLLCRTGGSGYFDTITGTDPTAAPPVEEEVVPEWWIF